MIVGLQVWHNREHLFHCLWYICKYVFTHILMFHNIIIPSYYLLHFYVSHCALFWQSNLVLSLYIDVVLTLSMYMSFVFMIWMCQCNGFWNIHRHNYDLTKWCNKNIFMMQTTCLKMSTLLLNSSIWGVPTILHRWLYAKLSYELKNINGLDHVFKIVV